MKLSVVIVNYNVKYFLEQCLHAVMKASANIEAEVFVIDNNSSDGSMEMVKQKFPSVQCIANKDNKGFSKANNQAIRIAKGEYILLLNPDTVVEEDTFKKIIRFMDEHPDAGALGVKMIDGSGKFLPESKRGLPTPMVAFYKISGLAKLFPKSRTFGRYHLSYLDKDKTHEVDILAGAFMLLRKSALDKTGLLDEDYFMYGEDIDISYRITKAGFKNYYFPETRIIHYKGESTKKSSVNYVFVFYNAMIIFARKHFSNKNAFLFSFLIRLAIYARAGAAILNRFIGKVFFPVLDFIILFIGMYILKDYWGRNVLVRYPEQYMTYAVPAYIVIWLTSVFFSGGYDQPVRLRTIVRGIITGTVLILVIYALLPEDYRFSRALILLGTVLAVVLLPAFRLFVNLFGWKKLSIENNNRKRLLIAGSPEESNRVLSLLQLSDNNTNFIGFVHPDALAVRSNGALGEYEKYFLGEVSNLTDIIEVYNIDEVIFCAKDLPSQQIIHFMSGKTNRNVEFKIAPPESLYIIGSSSVNNPGELYVIDINSISKTVNRRNKRVMDVLLSLLFLITSPVTIWFQRKPGGFFINIVSVLGGKDSWVGYVTTSTNSLPAIRKGILNPLDAINKTVDENTIHKLNLLYAKDYNVNNDLTIIKKGWRELGRR